MNLDESTVLCLYTPISLTVITVTTARHGAATMTALPLYFYSLPRPTSMTTLPEIYRCPDITLRSFSRFYTFNIGWRVLFEYECRTLPLVIIFTLPLVFVLLCSQLLQLTLESGTVGFYTRLADRLSSP